MKIVINTERGGFRLSDEAVERLAVLCGVPSTELDYYDVARNKPELVQVVEQMGPAANGRYTELKIVEIPDDVDWELVEDAGIEWIAEKHRTWS